MADEPFLQNSSNSSKPHSRHQNHHRHHQQQQQDNHHQIILHGQNHHQMLDQQQHQIHALAIAQVGQQSQQQQQPHSSPNVADQFASIQNNGRTLSLSLPLHQQQQQHHHLPQSSQQNRQQQQQQNQQPDLAARVHPAGGSGKSRAELTATGGHGRDDAWTEGATLALIDAWGERYLQLNRGNLKQKHWREVADEVNRRSALDENSSAKACKSDVQCKNRLDTLKKKYKIEKARLVSEGSPSKWTFFSKLEELVGPSKKGKKQRLAPPDPINNNNANAIATNNNVSGGLPSKMNLHQQQQPQQPSNSSSSKEYSAGMTDSCDNLNEGGKKRKIGAAAAVEGPFKDLARAIVKFGEVYERIESAKQQQMMDLERQRMEFTKDLELQRMQLFMQTQVELAKLKHGKHGGSNTEHYL